MINLVIGKINSGKSRFLEQHFALHKKGDGFVARKIMDNETIIGYQALRLTTGEARMWMLHEKYYRHDFIRYGQIGPYFFNQDLFDEIIDTLARLIKKGVAPIYVDEIGQLELDGSGFNSIMERLVGEDIESYVTVRRHLLGQVVDHYHIGEYRLIDVEEQ